MIATLLTFISNANAFSKLDGRLKLMPSASAWNNNDPIPKEETKDRYPVVLSHGMGDACDSPEFVYFVKKMSSELNRPVYCIGDYQSTNETPWSFFEDVWNGFFVNINEDVSFFQRSVEKIPELKDGFHAMGFSQGNLILRGYIERHNNPPVKTFISVHGPMMGIGGFPGCDPIYSSCATVFKYVSYAAYTSTAQNLSFQADYVRNPLLINSYLENGTFLPDMNNELNDDHNNKKGSQKLYHDNFSSIDKLILVKAGKEVTVMPPESEWFGFYKDGDYDTVLTYDQTDWYKRDTFGLKTLDENGKLVFMETKGAHCELEQQEFHRLIEYF